MPIVTKNFYKGLGRWRATCHSCGRFIGDGGFYDVIDNEEGYSLCAQHRKEQIELREKIYKQKMRKRAQEETEENVF